MSFATHPDTGANVQKHTWSKYNAPTGKIKHQFTFLPEKTDSMKKKSFVH